MPAAISPPKRSCVRRRTAIRCLVVSPANAINATLYEKLNFNFIRDIAPVASIMRAPSVMVVNPSVPAKTVPEFIAYAKANPGKINMASAGNGSGSHMAGELFKMMTGVDMVHVPYRGGGARADRLLGGQVQVMFPATTASIDIHQGRQAACAGSDHRDALGGAAGHPDRGRIRAGLRGESWSMASVQPKNTPAEIIDKLNKEINAGLADPKIKARLADWAARCFRARPPTSASSSPRKPRSGPR